MLLRIIGQIKASGDRFRYVFVVRAVCQKRNDLNKQILQCRSELSKICPAILVQSIRTKIQEVNSKLFIDLHQIKAQKFEKLTGPPITCDSSLESLNSAVTIPENYPLSDAEKSFLSKGLNCVPISKNLDEFSVKQDVEKFLRLVQLKAFFGDKKDDSNTSDKDIFETFQTRKSKWTHPKMPSKNAVVTSVSLMSIVTPNFRTSLRKRERR